MPLPPLPLLPLEERPTRPKCRAEEGAESSAAEDSEEVAAAAVPPAAPLLPGLMGGHRPETSPLAGHLPPSSTTTASNSETAGPLDTSEASSSTAPLREPLEEGEADRKLGIGGEIATSHSWNQSPLSPATASTV